MERERERTRARERVYVYARVRLRARFPLGSDQAKKVSGVTLEVFAASESVEPKKRVDQTFWLFVGPYISSLV